MAEWNVRFASAEDVSQMTTLDQICFTSPWSFESFTAELSNNPLARYLVAENHDSVIVGYAGLWAIGDEGHITNVAVHPDYRREGLAKMLIQTLIQRTRGEGLSRFTLEVRVSNLAAIRLYEGFGFQSVGVRPGYYEDNNEDALIMWLTTGETAAGGAG